MLAQSERRLRVLVAIASFGTANDSSLQRLIREYRAMSFDVDIVVLSNLNKALGPGVEVAVGLPTADPWSLPFAHKKIFADRIENYDLFVYSEDDTLITERILHDFMQVSEALNDDEIVGFLRFEEGPDGARNYPDVHGPFHWDPASLRVRGNYTLAHFTNEHAACYVLTQRQLRKATASGRFDVPPYEWKYDLLCTAATDPYTQCGFTKLIPVSHFDQFTVHHLPNKYVGRLGVDQQTINAQISALIEIAAQRREQFSLTQTETKLKRGAYSKDYYEPVNEAVISSIPKTARRVLSIGAGSGEMECALLDRALRVVATPLDSVISSRASSKGVEMTSSNLTIARQALHAERFDCIIFSNILHLVPDPVETLHLFSDLLSDHGIVIVRLVNMLTYKRFMKTGVHRLPDYARSGVHFCSASLGRQWCRRAGLVVETMKVASNDKRANLSLIPDSIKAFFASEIVLSATNTRNVSRPRQENSKPLERV